MIGRAASRPRRTLASPTEWLTGIGLHSGAPASIRVLPAPSETGIVFLAGEPRQEILAHVANIVDTSRCTQLGNGSVTVQTVEHLLSALAGSSIDDAIIEVEGGELPAVDGSALPYLRLLQSVGRREQSDGMPLRSFMLGQPLFISGEHGTSLLALPADSFRVTVVIDYPSHRFLGTQIVTFDAANQDYEVEIAPARTYGFLTELEWLHAHNLGLGASYENCIVLREDGYDVPIRFPDEIVRHKLLDVIGDLSLAGRSVAAHFIAVKPSHALNTKMAFLLAETPFCY